MGNQAKCLFFLGWLLEWVWKVCAFLRSPNQQWQCILREQDHSGDYHSGKYGQKVGGLSVHQDFCFLKSIIQPVGKTSSSSSENFQQVSIGTSQSILTLWWSECHFKKKNNTNLDQFQILFSSLPPPSTIGPMLHLDLKSNSSLWGKLHCVEESRLGF